MHSPRSALRTLPRGVSALLATALALALGACGGAAANNGGGAAPSAQPTAGGAGGEAQGSPWAAYTSREHGFAVDVPGPLQRTEEGGENGRPATIAYQLELSNAVAFRVQVNDFGQQIAGVPPEQVFDAGLRGAMQSTGSTVRSAAPAPLGAVPGRAFVADNPARGYVVYGRMLLVAQRMYLLLAVVSTPQEQPRRPDIDRFLGSFRLLEG